MTSRPLRLARDGRIEAPELLDEPRVARMMALLNRDGEETRIVGGAVRNALLGLPAGDIDLATTALPEAVMARAKRARLRTIPTGLAHGTVTVLDGGLPFEVTTLREDVETDGRHAVVRFGRDFGRDAERRDFTVNALSAGPDGTLYDTTGGRRGSRGRAGPLHRRRRDAHPRGLPPHPAPSSASTPPMASVRSTRSGLAAAVASRAGLDGLSRERVRAETLKLLAAPGTTALLGTLQQHGFLAQILGTDADVMRLARLVAHEGDAADPVLRLAALGARDPGAGRDVAAKPAIVERRAGSAGRRGIGARGLRGTAASAGTGRPSRDPLRPWSRPRPAMGSPWRERRRRTTPAGPKRERAWWRILSPRSPTRDAT